MLALLGGAACSWAQSTTGILQGQVTDPSAAAVPDATVTATNSGGQVSTTTTEQRGRYRIVLPAGSYTVRIASRGFGQFESTAVEISAGRDQTLDVRLQIQRERQTVTVADTAAVEVDPAQNAGQIVVKGTDLDALSDNTDDLARDLQALAGPSAGPNGPEIYIDGFAGGLLPPKESIREIRVNQNPFSAEFDKAGFGRIEVFTKPGTEKLHGQGFFEFGNRALTARNPYLLTPVVPDYQQATFGGNVGGALTKKSSFFVDTERRITDDNTLLNYTYLDPGLNVISVNDALVAPSRRFNITPRLDYALTANNTLIVRYAYVENGAQNQGITTQAFDLASRGYRLDTTEQNIQISETAVLGARAANDVKFQFFRTRSNRTGVSFAPEIDVQGAFTGGGTYPLNYTDRNRYEFQNYSTVIRTRHTVRFGVRVRDDDLNTQSRTNFNGRFIFSAQNDLRAIDVYRENQRLAGLGVAPSQIAAQGFGPSQFLITAGNPLTGINELDVSVFVQDDWRVKPNLTLSGGLRYEVQNQISDRTNFTPRIGVAWGPGGKGSRTPKTVIRAGAGIFYDRFTADLALNAAQLNGVNQTQYIIRNPAFFPEIPPLAAVIALSQQQGGTSTRGVYQVDAQLRAPYLIQSAVAIERQLPRNISLSVNYTNSRGLGQLRTRDINAPLPSSVDSQARAAGPRPYGTAAGDIYQYEGSGIFKQNQVVISVNSKINNAFSLYGYYVYGRAMSDTDGPGTFPSNPYDLRSEYGRASFDNRHRGFVSGNVTAPFKIRLAPFIFLQSGRPYNLTSGQDINNDGNPNDDRPAFAQDPSRPSVISKPGFGTFDIAPASLKNAVLVPRNYLEAPGILSLNVRVSRTWTFGESSGGTTGGDAIKGGAGIGSEGLGGGQSGLASVFGGAATKKRYNLTLTASFRNVLNNVNPATPIGNLSSAYFGKSVALNTFGPLPGLPNTASGNRHIELQARLSF